MPRITPLDSVSIAGDPAAVRRLIAEHRGALRALRNLTQGSRQMEYAAEVVSRMNMATSDDAVRHMRRATFGDRAYPDDLPLSEIEREMATKNHSPFVILMTYAVVAPVIGRQLSEMQRERSAAKKPD